MNKGTVMFLYLPEAKQGETLETYTQRIVEEKRVSVITNVEVPECLKPR